MKHKIVKVGNLALGGSGKTPFTEYLIEEFSGEFKLAVVSRGYGRKEDNLHVVSTEDSALAVGDEPAQMKGKYPNIPLVLKSDRVTAINHVLQEFPENDCILLDDAMQHRKLKGGLQLLLTSLNNPFYQDFIMPSGKLRDLRKRAISADAIVLTKIVRDDFDEAKEKWIRQALHKYNKPVFFSSFEYKCPKHLLTDQVIGSKKVENILLITGIAEPQPLVNKAKEYCNYLKHLPFRDHHYFSREDMLKFLKEFNAFHGESAIFTTEKDAQRLLANPHFNLIEKLPIFSVGIQIRFIKEEEKFKRLIRNYVREN